MYSTAPTRVGNNTVAVVIHHFVKIDYRSGIGEDGVLSRIRGAQRPRLAAWRSSAWRFFCVRYRRMV